MRRTTALACGVATLSLLAGGLLPATAAQNGPYFDRWTPTSVACNVGQVVLQYNREYKLPADGEEIGTWVRVNGDGTETPVLDQFGGTTSAGSDSSPGRAIGTGKSWEITYPGNYRLRLEIRTGGQPIYRWDILMTCAAAGAAGTWTTSEKTNGFGTPPPASDPTTTTTAPAGPPETLPAFSEPPSPECAPLPGADTDLKYFPAEVGSSASKASNFSFAGQSASSDGCTDRVIVSLGTAGGRTPNWSVFHGSDRSSLYIQTREPVTRIKSAYEQALEQLMNIRINGMQIFQSGVTEETPTLTHVARIRTATEDNGALTFVLSLRDGAPARVTQTTKDTSTNLTVEIGVAPPAPIPATLDGLKDGIVQLGAEGSAPPCKWTITNVGRSCSRAINDPQGSLQIYYFKYSANEPEKVTCLAEARRRANETMTVAREHAAELLSQGCARVAYQGANPAAAKQWASATVQDAGTGVFPTSRASEDRYTRTFGRALILISGVGQSGNDSFEASLAITALPEPACKVAGADTWVKAFDIPDPPPTSLDNARTLQSVHAGPRKCADIVTLQFDFQPLVSIGYPSADEPRIEIRAGPVTAPASMLSSPTSTAMGLAGTLRGVTTTDPLHHVSDVNGVIDANSMLVGSINLDAVRPFRVTSTPPGLRPFKLTLEIGVEDVRDPSTTPLPGVDKDQLIAEAKTHGLTFTKGPLQVVAESFVAKQTAAGPAGKFVVGWLMFPAALHGKPVSIECTAKDPGFLQWCLMRLPLNSTVASRARDWALGRPGGPFAGNLSDSAVFGGYRVTREEQGTQGTRIVITTG